MKNSGSLLLLLTVAGCSQLWAADGALTGDTYVSTTAPNSNFGAMTTLSVGGGSTAFVQFDLSSLPAGTTAASIASAQLIFYVDRVEVTGSVELHAVAAPWTETTLTTGSSSIAPAAFATVVIAPKLEFTAMGETYASAVSTASAAHSRGQPMAASRTSHATAATAAPGTQIFVDSKENTATSHPARLQINLIGPTGATGPAGAPGPAGAQGAAGSTGAAGTSPYVFQAVTKTLQISCGTPTGCNISQTIAVTCPTNFLRFSPVNSVTPLPSLTTSIVVPPFTDDEFDFVYTGTLNDGQITILGGSILCVGGVPL